MRAPCVAVIGRPNVGKSTLFNILTDSRKAVVKDRPGVTRDIQRDAVDIWGAQFDLLDTGGWTRSQDFFSPLVRKQVAQLLEDVDLILVVVDGRAGFCPEDRDVVSLAQASGKDFLIVVNKVDVDGDEAAELAKSDFYSLGSSLVATSFEKRRGIDEVIEWIKSKLGESGSTVLEGKTLAIVGKPNVGKSSLVNYLLRQDRMLVSERAGTTVDAVDSQLFFNGKPYVLVDTAGLRRSARRTDDVEIISAFKARDSIARADIVLLMVDLLDGLSDQDAHILSQAFELGKTVILVGNKSDLAKERQTGFRNKFREQVEEVFHFFPDIPMVFISAKTGQGVGSLFSKIEEVWEKLHLRIPTSHLNDFFTHVIRQAPAPVHGTRNVKFYYLTQTRQVPPSFIAFANFPESITPAYRRFLSKRIQEKWDLRGIPVRIFAMKKGGKSKARVSR